MPGLVYMHGDRKRMHRNHANSTLAHALRFLFWLGLFLPVVHFDILLLSCSLLLWLWLIIRALFAENFRHVRQRRSIGKRHAPRLAELATRAHDQPHFALGIHQPCQRSIHRLVGHRLRIGLILDLLWVEELDQRAIHKAGEHPASATINIFLGIGKVDDFAGRGLLDSVFDLHVAPLKCELFGFANFTRRTGTIPALVLFIGDRAALAFVLPRTAPCAVGVEVPALDGGLAAVGELQRKRVLLLVAPVAVVDDLAGDLLEACEPRIAKTAGERGALETHFVAYDTIAGAVNIIDFVALIGWCLISHVRYSFLKVKNRC